MHYCVVTSIVTFISIFAGALGEENCGRCVLSENCQHFNNLNRRDQQNWKRQFSCQHPDTDESSYHNWFSPLTEEEYVCCPEFPVIETSGNKQKSSRNFWFAPNYYPPYDPNFRGDDFTHSQRKSLRKVNSNYSGKLKQSPNVPNGLRPNTRIPPTSNPSYNNFQPGFNKVGIVSTPRPQLVFPVTTPNYKTVNIQPQIPNVNIDNKKLGDECPTSVLPPNPANGCCGLDTFGLDGTTDIQSMISERISNLNSNKVRIKRQTENDSPGAVDLDNRIAGGSETELNQFPWTVLLRSSFDFGGNNISNFDCGGSIISSRYVLTAAHCVIEEGATLRDVVIYMAEYDKRTFPRDCKVSANGMTSCITNVAVKAEKVIPHIAFNSKSLHNDIALIRLREFAPYTEFIRPICLTPFDINNEAFYGLPLPVAGWGRNGPYVSNVKQSTVLNLVGRNLCLQYYPSLQSSHLCAVGRTGEDTCKGDSGGPLMMLYGGKYYVVGIVSGKRSDVPCGTAVPTLYTNVFQYLQWIGSNIE